MTEAGMFHRPDGIAYRSDGAKIMTMAPTKMKAAGVPAMQETKRVCAYARVSTDHEEQLSSYDAQVDHYTRYIRGRMDWEFAGIYTDEGITGTSTKHREGFKQMVADAHAGKFDMIITKSVSRFARNTVDSLITIRELKEKGIGVFFEKEGIDTLDSKGELLLTIMSSLAQEESRSISENCTWGVRKRFADGKVSVAYSRFLGYDKGDGEQLVINEEEAKIVRRIYRLFLQGDTPSGIARLLTEEGIPTPSQKKKWHASTIESILTNEKYKGDAMLQKTFTTDFLTKKSKVNQGEIPQYYVVDSHPAIITKEQHDLVQYELRKRYKQTVQRTGRTKNGRLCFSSRIYCADCSSYYGSKVWHSTSKYRRIIWQCNHKFSNEAKCSTPHVTEKQIEEAFLSAINKVAGDISHIIKVYQGMIEMLSDTTALEQQIEELSLRKRGLTAAMEELVVKNANVAQDQDSFMREYQPLDLHHKDLSQQIQSLHIALQERSGRSSALKKAIRTWGKIGTAVAEFDDEMFIALVDHVTVHPDGSILFTFMDGSTC